MKKLTTGIVTVFGAILLMLFFTTEAEALDIDLEPINFTFAPDFPVKTLHLTQNACLKN